MATLLFSTAITEQYKEVSELINSVEVGKKEVRVKGLRDLMQESFFHGASWIGNNFIA
jgi:hypothetical protein